MRPVSDEYAIFITNRDLQIRAASFRWGRLSSRARAAPHATLRRTVQSDGTIVLSIRSRYRAAAAGENAAMVGIGGAEGGGSLRSGFL